MTGWTSNSATCINLLLRGFNVCSGMMWNVNNGANNTPRGPKYDIASPVFAMVSLTVCNLSYLVCWGLQVPCHAIPCRTNMCNDDPSHLTELPELVFLTPSLLDLCTVQHSRPACTGSDATVEDPELSMPCHDPLIQTSITIRLEHSMSLWVSK